MPHSSTGRAVESGARTPRRMHRGGIQSLLVLRRDAEVKYSLDIKKNTPFVRVLTPARIRAGCRSARVMPQQPRSQGLSHIFREKPWGRGGMPEHKIDMCSPCLRTFYDNSIAKY